jgi:streptogrisin C
MQRRTVAVIAATVTAAGAAVAFTLPSMAGTSSTRAAKPAAVAPELLAAMKRDKGLTADQATAAVRRAAWASGVAATLRSDTGSAYAGSWLTDKGTTLNIAVTDASMAAQVQAAGAVPKLVTRSVAQLDAAKKALDSAATKADRSLPGWYVDVPANKVTIQGLPGQTAKAQALAANAGIPASALKVVTTKAAPRPLADGIGAQPYFISLAEGTARCSIGFSVEGGFVTAGHCGAVGDQTTGFNQLELGSVVASTFPGNADFGVVKITGDFTPQPFVDDFNGNALPVGGSTEAPVGATVCRSGSTTGTHCGTILAKNQTVNYPEGTVTGLTQTDACAEGGDSGGPWLVGDQAQGVTSGGSGDCTVGGETFFQPVNEILDRNKLTLLTTAADGGGLPSADPSAEPTADPSAEPPADPGAEPPADPGAEPPADPSAEPTADPGAEPTDGVPPAGPHRHHHR